MVDEFIIYDDMQYTRRDWRNRNKIKTKDGVKWLTIPVEVKGKYFQKINETKINDKYWGKNHWEIINYNYKKAKFFKDYEDVFGELYLNCEEEFLSKINYRFIKVICEVLGIKTLMKWSDEFDLLEDRNARLIDICKGVGATDYYSGPAAQAYMDLKLFEEENIKVHFFDYSGYPEYFQLHGEFDHAVSIIDLIFNEGANTKKFMKSFDNEK